MRHSKTTRITLVFYGMLCLAFSYIPIIAIGLASLAESPYLSFPLRSYSIGYYQEALTNDTVIEVLLTSFLIAIVVAIFAMIFGFFSGLAFGRYQWRFRKIFQKFILIPIFFPQTVLGLSLLLWFNVLGVSPSWITAVIAHLVWIGPISTLLVSIQAYSLDPQLEDAARDMNANSGQVLSKITLPLLWPSTMAAGIFGFLLSWGNFGLSLYTTGVDTTFPVWAYAQMVQSYTPLVPVVGILSLFLSALLLILGIFIARFSITGRTSASVSEKDGEIQG